MENFLLQAFVFLASASLIVPIAKRLGLGSTMGYLIAGILIGPYCLSFAHDIEVVKSFTEFGVVMMLFIIGLELKPSLLWKMRTSILGMGGFQVALATILISGLSIIFLPWRQALAVGLMFSISSTAIVLQILKEKDLMNTHAGKSIFSVLLFQDLVVIPIMALFPFLGKLSTPDSLEAAEGVVLNMSSFPAYVQWLIIIGVILVIFFGAKFLSIPIFRAAASTKMQEVFVAAALALIIGVSFLMSLVGLSPALGAFLAGVVLSDSEYRHELESNIEPFKGLFMGVFFMAIGASLNLIFIKEHLLLVLGVTLLMMLIKYLADLIVGFSFHIKGKDRLLFSLSLVQAGGFGFVLLQIAKSSGVFPISLVDLFNSAIAISMFLTPFVFILYDQLITRAGCKEISTNKEHVSDTIKSQGHKVILAGFGRLGTDVGRFLMAAGVKPTILDNDAARVSILRKYGYEVYYGDVTRFDLLKSAGAADAEVLVVSIKNLEKSRKLIEMSKKYFPNLKIVANAYDSSMTYELMDLEVDKIQKETYGSALEIGRDVLDMLGVETYASYRMMRLFRKKENDMMPNLKNQNRIDENNYISAVKQHDAVLENLLANSMQMNTKEVNKAWRSDNLEN
ncbi:MAG: monovalent cation:proton antiporter-2 (CPA2) family protein [Bacteroidales bacterium]